MKSATLWLIWVLVLALVSLACAPKSTTVSPQAPAAPAATAFTFIPAASTISPEEAAGRQVVEAAKKEGKATLYSYYFIGDVGLAVAQAFKNTYQIDLEIIGGRGSEFNARIATEQQTKQYTADLMDTNPSWMLAVKDKGFTTSLTGLPVLREKGVWAYAPAADQDGHLFIFTPNPVANLINTQMVKPTEEPESWYDLLQPKWKGKISIIDPQASNGPDTFTTILINHNALNLDYFRQLAKQDLQFAMGGTRDVARLVARGEVAIGIQGGARASAMPFLLEGAPVKIVGFKEGHEVLTNQIGAIKNGPHPNAARLFVNWLLSPEGQAVWTKASGFESMRNDTQGPSLPGPATMRKPLLQTLKDVVDIDTNYKQGRAKAIFREGK